MLFFFCEGEIPATFFGGVEGPDQVSAASGCDEALRGSEERGPRHQEPQMVRFCRLHRHLSEEGSLPFLPLPSSVQGDNETVNLTLERKFTKTVERTKNT